MPRLGRAAKMNRQIDLVWLGSQEEGPDWPLGEVWPTEPTPLALHQRVLERLPGSKAEAWLFWDRQFGLPSPEVVAKALTLPGDLWHAGLLLAMGGKPRLIDLIAATWMLNCDPAVTFAATSWRLSLRACLVRTEALRQLGDVHPQFRTLEGASLEMGHRYVVRGGLTRHLPALAPGVRVRVPPQLPFEDELRFVYHGFGRFWSRWAWLQAVLTREVSLGTAWRAQRAVYQNPAPAKPGPCAHAEADSNFDPQSARVSVLIPTLDRNPYLRKLLDQLRRQTVSPLDIVVIDQTAIERRDMGIADDFGDLPLRLIYR